VARVLIIGANSDIARALARRYAGDGDDLYLAGRDVAVLDALASDLHIRSGVDVQCFELDVLATDSHQAFFDSLPSTPSGVIAAAGYLGDQHEAETDFSEARRIIETNFTGLVSLLDIAAGRLEAKQDGFIIGISSVAGDRGRKSNYIYGASKAALTTYLSGLRNRLYDSNVHVLTVKPGFVDTRMTQGMNLPPALTAHPDKVAKDIVRAQRKGRSVLYTLGIWRLIMLVIRLVPEAIFKRMSL
jgi:short-subunit dehydrogenase